MKLFLITLAIISCLLMSNIANAQCAWVLWESDSNDGYLHWQVGNAFPSYEKCKEVQRIKCELRKKSSEDAADKIKYPNTNVKMLADNCPDFFVMFYQDSSHPREIDYKCLPDTVDPRK